MITGLQDALNQLAMWDCCPVKIILSENDYYRIQFDLLEKLSPSNRHALEHPIEFKLAGPGGYVTIAKEVR